MEAQLEFEFEHVDIADTSSPYGSVSDSFRTYPYGGNTPIVPDEAVQRAKELFDGETQEKQIEFYLNLREVKIVADVMTLAARECAVPFYANELKDLQTKFQNLERKMNA